MAIIKNHLSNGAISLMIDQLLQRDPLGQITISCSAGLNQAIGSEALYPLITKQGFIFQAQMVTIFHLFARYGCSAAISYFLGQGYDPDMVNKVEFNQIIISDTGKQTPQIIWTNYTDITPLMYSITWNQSGIANTLISAGANVNLIDSYSNMTALMYALKDGNSYIASQIIATPGVNINLTDTAGFNALMYEAKFDYATLANQTLYLGTNVSAEDVGGQTALDIATEYGNLDVVGIINAYIATHP